MAKSHQSSTDLPHKQAPLSFEHTLKLKNEPDEDLPEAIKRELPRPKIYLRAQAAWETAKADPLCSNAVRGE